MSAASATTSVAAAATTTAIAASGKEIVDKTDVDRDTTTAIVTSGKEIVDKKDVDHDVQKLTNVRKPTHTKKRKIEQSCTIYPMTIYTVAVVDVDNKPRAYEIVNDSYTTKRAALVHILVRMADHLVDTSAFRNLLDLTDYENENEPKKDTKDPVFAAFSKYVSHERYNKSHLREWLQQPLITEEHMTHAMERLNDLFSSYLYSIEEKQLFSDLGDNDDE